MQRLFLLSFFILLAGCSNKYSKFTGNYQFDDQTGQPDYHSLNYWAAHPSKRTVADSVPEPLRQEPKDTLADVFFIHPTTYTELRLGWYADVNDPYTNAKTDYTSILYQASVFNQHCRIFAPRYRQVHLSAFLINNEESKAAFDTAYADVRRAFLYYLEHFNHNRPIIIAGHSQGGLMSGRLLSEFFDGKPLQKQLVAAYIVGWPVFENQLTEIPLCRDSLQTGCFCSWRTFRKDYLAGYVEKENQKAMVTNPLTWTTTPEYAGKELNEGSVLRRFNSIIPHTADAWVAGNVIWVHKPHFPGAMFINTRNLHIADINLYYVNMRKNVEQRIRAYLKTKGTMD
jgi:pimeloyl-ACP methyl ester carboxylesterase